MARPIVLTDRCQVALDAQPDDPLALVRRRSEVLDCVIDLAAACADENCVLFCAVHPNVLLTAKPRNISFMKELSCLCGGCDHNLWLDYTSGLPMYGRTRRSCRVASSRAIGTFFRLPSRPL